MSLYFQLVSYFLDFAKKTIKTPKNKKQIINNMTFLKINIKNKR